MPGVSFRAMPLSSNIDQPVCGFDGSFTGEIRVCTPKLSVITQRASLGERTDIEIDRDDVPLIAEAGRELAQHQVRQVARPRGQQAIVDRRVLDLPEALRRRAPESDRRGDHCAHERSGRLVRSCAEIDLGIVVDAVPIEMTFRVLRCCQRNLFVAGRTTDRERILQPLGIPRIGRIRLRQRKQRIVLRQPVVDCAIDFRLVAGRDRQARGYRNALAGSIAECRNEPTAVQRPRCHQLPIRKRLRVDARTLCIRRWLQREAREKIRAIAARDRLRIEHAQKVHA